MTIRCFIFLAAYCSVISAYGQARAGAAVDEKPRVAYVKIFNACDTSQPERWRTGLDLNFKGNTIGRDIRIGERGPVGKITFTGKDAIEVYRSGDDAHVLASVPALLQPGGSYTLVVIGKIEASTSDLNVSVIEEFPIPPQSKRPDQCRVILLNAVESFPVALSVGKEFRQPLPFGEQREVFLVPGGVDLGIWFNDSKGIRRRLQAGMIATAGGNYTAVIHPSEERSDRPSLFRSSATEDRASIRDMEKSAEIHGFEQ